MDKSQQLFAVFLYALFAQIRNGKQKVESVGKQIGNAQQGFLLENGIGWQSQFDSLRRTPGTQGFKERGMKDVLGNLGLLLFRGFLFRGFGSRFSF